jgi:hypothetical protein
VRTDAADLAEPLGLGVAGCDTVERALDRPDLLREGGDERQHRLECRGEFGGDVPRRGAGERGGGDSCDTRHFCASDLNATSCRQFRKVRVVVPLTGASAGSPSAATWRSNLCTRSPVALLPPPTGICARLPARCGKVLARFPVT